MSSARRFSECGQFLFRDREKERFVHALDDLERGCGRVIELVGEPGIGKTELLADLMREASRRGVRTLAGGSVETDREVPFHVLGQALSWLRGDAASNEERAKLAAALDHAEPSRQAVHRAARLLIERHAAGGLLMAFDDFHWADDASVDFLGELIRWPPEAPVLLVIAHRPRQASDRLTSALAHGMQVGTVERIEPAPLTRERSAQLIGLPAESPRLARLHEQAGGNPLYLLGLAGSAEPGDCPANPAAGIPEETAALLLGELAFLDRAETSVMRAAAVLGDRFDVHALAPVAQLDHASTCAAVAGLTRRDLLRAVDPTRFGFRHSVLRMAIHQRLDPCWRQSAHRRALEMLSGRAAPASERAEHVEHASPAPGAMLVDLRHLLQAVEETIWTEPGVARHWLEVAARLVSDGLGPNWRAVDEPVSPMPVPPFERRIRDCRDLLREILDGVTGCPTDLRVAMVMLCAQAESLIGRRDEAAALLTLELEAFAGEQDPPLEIVALFLYRTTIEASKGGIPEVDEVERILSLARRHGHRLYTAGALAMRGLCAAVTGEATGAAGDGDAVTESAAFIDPLSDAELTAHPEYFAVLAWSEIFVGRLTSAQRHFTRGVSIAHRAGRGSSLAPLLNGMCYLALLLGPAAESDAALAEARAVADLLSSAELRGMTLALEAANALWSDGLEGDELVARAEQAVVTLQPGSSWNVSATLTLARALMVAGDPQRCTQLITTLGGGPELRALPLLLRPLCYEILTAAAVQGGLPAAADWAARAGSTAEVLKGHQPFQQAYAALAQGHLRSRHEHSAAAGYYRRGAELFGASDMAASQAWALIMAASKAAAAGQPAEATPLVVLAKDLARRCGASRAYTAAERLQRSWSGPQGTRQQRTAAVTLAVLTDREREIAEFAGTGRKTREIAEELGLSPRTVDVHLTRIYRKLDIGSRAALARLITLAGSPDAEEPGTTFA